MLCMVSSGGDSLSSNQHRISGLPTGAVVRFSGLLVAITIAGHYNPLRPNISPGDLNVLSRIVRSTSRWARGSYPNSLHSQTVTIDEGSECRTYVMPGTLVDIIV